MVVELIAGLSSRLYKYEHNEDFVWRLNVFTGFGLIFGLCAGPYLIQFGRWDKMRHTLMAAFFSLSTTVLFLLFIAQIARY